MSSSGTWTTTAPNSSGYRVSMLPVSRPPLRPAHRAEVLRRGDLALDQVARHGGEVLVGPVPLVAQRRLVPRGTVLAAAADVRHDVDAPVRQPGASEPARVRRRQRDLEAAVAVEQRRRRAVVREVARADDEVRHARAVVGGGEVLLDEEAVGVEVRRHRLEQDRLGVDAARTEVEQRERGRRQVVGRVEPHRVVLVGVDRSDLERPELGDVTRVDAVPLGSGRRRRGEDLQPAPDVGQHLEHEVVRGECVPGQRARSRRREQHGEVALAVEERREADREQRPRLVRLSSDLPVLAQLDEHLVALHAGLGRVGHVDLGERDAAVLAVGSR